MDLVLSLAKREREHLVQAIKTQEAVCQQSTYHHRTVAQAGVETAHLKVLRQGLADLDDKINAVEAEIDEKLVNKLVSIGNINGARALLGLDPLVAVSEDD